MDDYKNLSKTYSYLSISLIFMILGVMFGNIFLLEFITEHTIITFITFLIIELGVLFLIFKYKTLLLLNLFTFVSGLSLSMSLTYYLNVLGSLTFMVAIGITFLILVIMTLLTITLKLNFSKLGPMLFISLIIVIIGMIINIFLQSSLLMTIITIVSAIVFTLYIGYDTQKALEGENAIIVAVGLYLDIINLLLDILRLLSIFNGDD